jgi:hypothetical protein
MMFDPNNNVSTTFEIHPYKIRGMWVFDDDRIGLEQEPFVSGADVMIDDFVQEIPGAENGFTLVFSHRPFQGHLMQLEWQRNEYGGCWYTLRERNIAGRLSPALLRYYDTPPEELYVEFRRKSD